MDRETVVAILEAHREELRAFGVTAMYLFGSVARARATAESDVDVLVEFESGSPTFRQHMGLLLYLERLLGVRVDLATPRTIPSGVARAIEPYLIRVA